MELLILAIHRVYVITLYQLVRFLVSPIHVSSATLDYSDNDAICIIMYWQEQNINKRWCGNSIGFESRRQDTIKSYLEYTHDASFISLEYYHLSPLEVLCLRLDLSTADCCFRIMQYHSPSACARWLPGTTSSYAYTQSSCTIISVKCFSDFRFDTSCSEYRTCIKPQLLK